MTQSNQPPLKLAEAIQRLAATQALEQMPWEKEKISSPAAIMCHAMGLKQLTPEQLDALKRVPFVERFYNDCLIEFGSWRDSEVAARAIILHFHPDAKHALELPGLRLLPMVAGSGASKLVISASNIGPGGEAVVQFPSLPGSPKDLHVSDLSPGDDTVAKLTVTFNPDSGDVRVDCAAFPIGTWHLYFLGSTLPENSTTLDRRVFVLHKAALPESCRKGASLWELIGEGRLIEALAEAERIFADDSRQLTFVHWAIAARMELLVRQAILTVEFKNSEHARLLNDLVEIADRRLDAVKQSMIDGVRRQE